MIKYFIERQVGWSMEKIELEAAEVLAMARQGLSEMEYRLKEQDKSYCEVAAGNPATFFHTYYSLSLLSKRRNVAGFSTRLVDDIQSVPEEVDEFTVDLKNAIQAQKNTITQLEKAPVEFGGQFFSAFTSGPSVVKVFSGLHCPDCGYVIGKAQFSAHRVSMRCMTDSSNKDVREGGFVELTQGADIAACRKAGIPCELRPNGYSMWAPPWVDDAMTAYRKNDGFAGLSLTEYLKKMKPTDNN